MAEPQKSEIPDLPNLGESPATLNNVIDFASRADKRTQAFINNVLGRIQNDLDAHETEVEARWADIDVDKTVRKNAIDKEIGKFRSEAVEASADERTSVLRELQAISDLVDSSEGLFSSPQVMLAQEFLGSEKRSRYLEQMGHAGPIELKNHAILAVTKKDKELGAAVLSILDRMSRRDRPFNATSLAVQLVGQEFDEAQAAIAIVRNRLSEAKSLNRSLERGRSHKGMTDKISIGLAKREEAKLREKIKKGR